jgi:transposase
MSAAEGRLHSGHLGGKNCTSANISTFPIPRLLTDRLAPSHDLAKAINYILSRWVVFTRFLNDGRICLSNNAAERAVRCVAVGRKNWTFAGSDSGGHRAAAAYTLIETCKLNDVDPQPWLADVLARLPDHPASRIAELLASTAGRSPG